MSNTYSMSVIPQPLSVEVIIIHRNVTSIRTAHEAARTVKGIRVCETFRDGWGRTVTMAVAHGGG